mmetsp:Transcript_120829/g.352995  ORF Transcript_120829/g.352995 Transcript_120829/m.352995 type:complete len:262 (+) Transcript_120829:62-847(+)
MAPIDLDGKFVSSPEPGLHPDVEELLQELPLAVHKVIRIFLLSQQLDTVRDLAALHADDLTEAFKATPPDFTLGHRAAMRRLCTAARERFGTPPAGATHVAARQPLGEYHDNMPQTPTTCRGEGWNKVPRSPRGSKESAARSPRSAGNHGDRAKSPVRSPRTTSPSRWSVHREGAPSEASTSRSGFGASKGSFGRAWSNCQSGRETLWSRLMDKASDGTGGPGLHQHASQFGARPASPRAVMGTTPRPADLFASTIGVRGS